MIRLFGLMSFLCALLALAVRQGVDLQEMALQTHLFASYEKSANEAQITVQKKQAVSGHNSLNTLSVYSIQAVDGECRNVINKVKDLAKEELALSSTAGRSIDEDVDKAFLRDSSERGQRELSEAFAVLDQSDLRDVLKTDEIWRLGDQDILVRCETNQSIRIEEESRTATGEPLLQGDVLVPSEESGSLLEMTMLVAEGARWAGHKWETMYTGETYVPYCFHPDLDEGAKKAFLAAVEHTSSQVSCLHFIDVGYNDGRLSPVHQAPWVAKSNIHESNIHGPSCSVLPSIVVQDTDRERCWSRVGMPKDFQDYFRKGGSSQPLNLGFACQTMAVAAHELGHALGMLHEQSRTDRDQYIVVHWDNIPEDKQQNFNMQAESWQSQIYDPLSLMHYDPNAFAKDTTRPTITANNSRVTALLGQRLGWSEQDVLELAGRYCLSEGHSWVRYRGAKVHKAQPKVSQQTILEKLVGRDFKPASKFAQLLVPSSTPSFCISFEPLDEDHPKRAVKGCDVNSGLRTGFCQWRSITNVCKKRVKISCPHEDPQKPMIFEPASGTGTINHGTLLIYKYLTANSTTKGATLWVKETWKELEMGMCGVYVEP